MSEERAHSLIGFSGAERLLNCSASLLYQINNKIPPKTSAQATRGQKLHDCTEISLKHKIDYELTGELFPDPVFHEDGEDLNEVETAVDLVWKNVLEESITGKAYGFEDKFDIENPWTPLFSYIDFWCVHINDRAKRVLSIVDYKFGSKNVSADNNAQGKGYALCVLKFLEKHGKSIDIIKFYIIQPGLSEPLKQTEFTHKELETFLEKYFKQVETVYTGKKVKHKTGPWCFFCPAKSPIGDFKGCTEYYAETTKNRHLALLQKDKPQLPKIEELSTEQIVAIGKYGKDMITCIEECQDYLKAKMLAGESFEGLELKERKGNRKIDETLLPKYIPADVLIMDFYTQKLKPLGEIENILAANQLDVMDKITTRADSSYSIVEKKQEKKKLLKAEK